jgi:hypothetical protein
LKLLLSIDGKFLEEIVERDSGRLPALENGRDNIRCEQRKRSGYRRRQATRGLMDAVALFPEAIDTRA